VTDEDRQLLTDMQRMTEACGVFCTGVLDSNLSRDDQLELALWLIDVAQRVLKRVLDTPGLVIESDS
jgi:hypothetical protein